MVVKINGNKFQAGDFNRDLEYIYVYTAFEVDNTGVLNTRAELLAEGVLTSATLSATNNIVIDGVDYTVDATYDNALWTASNLLVITDVITAAAQATVVGFNFGNVAGNSVQLDAQRLPGTATVFGTNMVDTADGFWFSIFSIEGNETQAIAADAANGIAAVTAVSRIETALTGAGLFLNTANADGNNEDSMGGVLAVGDVVDGEVSAGDRNLIVATAATIIA